MFKSGNGTTIPNVTAETSEKQTECYTTILDASRRTLRALKQNREILYHYAMYWPGITELVDESSLEDENDLVDFILIFFPDANGQWVDDMIMALDCSRSRSSEACVQCCDRVEKVLADWLHSDKMKNM